MSFDKPNRSSHLIAAHPDPLPAGRENLEATFLLLLNVDVTIHAGYVSRLTARKELGQNPLPD